MKEKGFTLVELLVTITIVGILATISLGSFRGYFEQARNATRQTDVSNISRVIKASRATTEELPFRMFADTDPGTPKLSTVLSEHGFNIPTDPGDQCYIYGYHSTLNSKDFFVASADPTTNTLILDGTGQGIIGANNETADLLTMITSNCTVNRNVNNYTVLYLNNTGTITSPGLFEETGGGGGISIF